MTEIIVKQGGTTITIRMDGEGNVSFEQPEEAVNIGSDFQAPIDRPANINDNVNDIIAERNNAFVEQFASELTKDPIHGNIALDAVEGIVKKGGQKDGKAKEEN